MVDWGHVLDSGIAVLPAVITSLAGLIVSLRNRAAIAEVKTATNGMKAELVSAARIVGVHEGIEQGRVEAGTTAEIAAKLEERVVKRAEDLERKMDVTAQKTEEIHNAVAQRRKDDHK